jgi:predicted AAA+ superfamily ATPase
MQIIDIIDYYSFWSRDVPRTFPRQLQLPERLSAKYVTAVQGVRRCGKSTLLTQLIERYKLDPVRCAFINFEDPRLISERDSSLLDRIVQNFRELRGPGELYFFFDEIQNVENWESWFHGRLERNSGEVFVITGSNSRLLSRELGSALTGRHLSLELFPFSFSERSAQSQIALEDYLKQGGFPAVIDIPEAPSLLRQYFLDIAQRDIVARLGLSQPKVVSQLVKMLYEATGSEISFRKLAGALGVSADTVNEYVSHCESSYLVMSCPYFTFSEKQRIRRNSKYYSIDSGMRRAVVTKTGQDLGKDFEAMVFLELRRRFREVYYWRGRGEVDFVVVTKDGVRPVQVTLSEPLPRHEGALEEFFKEFPDALPEVFITGKTFLEAIDSI